MRMKREGRVVSQGGRQVQRSGGDTALIPYAAMVSSLMSLFTFNGEDFYTFSGAKPSYDTVLGDVSHDTGRWPSLS
jgi:hypothetical protein